MKLRRSIAWTYGNDPDRTRRQIESACDAITIDLEDAVVPSMKPEARVGALAMLTTWDFRGKERILRINGFGTEDYRLDMQTVVAPGLPDAIRLPKCENPHDVLVVDRQLGDIEAQAGLPTGSIEILAMIETPLGVRNAYDIAACCGRVTALSLGMEDLTTEIGVTRRYVEEDTDFLYVKQKLVIDGKAACVQVIDSGLNKLCSAQYNIAYSAHSRRLGFDGRSVRDDEQARIANTAYGPTAEEIDWAKRAIAEFERADRQGDSHAYVDGRHLCAAAVAKAHRILMQQEAIAKRAAHEVDTSRIAAACIEK